MAPFKLPLEYIDVLDGIGSAKYLEFRDLIKSAFKILRKNSDSLLMLVELMEKDSFLPCFTGANSRLATSSSIEALAPFTDLKGGSVHKTSSAPLPSSLPVSAALRARLFPTLIDAQLDVAIDVLIDSSCGNTFTTLYDQFQFYSQGVF
jgi:phosphatidylinositol kinase/protein kinase (PI-3  family)